MNLLLTLLAQTSDPTSAPAGGPAGGGSLFTSPLIPLVLVMVVFWFIMSRGRNKDRQRYEEMLNSLKKNDRVQTIGGVLGTVVDVRENEVVLKVDEQNNVRMRFNRTAIKEVLRDAPPSDAKGGPA
jgi:preprotein translocase subunit YajC